jgi:hypothetical protein
MEEDDSVYRVRADTDWGAKGWNPGVTSYYGPYGTLAAARGQATALARQPDDYFSIEVVTTVECMVGEWKKVEE